MSSNQHIRAAFPVSQFLLDNTPMLLESLRHAGIPVAGKKELQGVENGTLRCWTEKGLNGLMRYFEWTPPEQPKAARPFDEEDESEL